MAAAVFAAVLAGRASDFDVLRVKWCEMLTQGTNASRLDPLYSNWISQVETTGQSYWNALDTSSNRTNLFYNYPNLATDSSDITTTYERLRAMALAYGVSGSALQGNSTLFRNLTNGLDWMTRYYSPTGAIYDNWYDFEIAIPRALNDTVLLLYSNLAPAHLSNYMSAIEHFSPTPSSTSITTPVTAYNKVLKSMIVSLRGVIVKDAAKIDLGRLALSDVFTNVTTGDGFYADGSFIFHDEYAYNTGYGIGLLDTMGSLLQLLRGSPWEPTDPARTNVFRWVYEAYEPFLVRGAAMEMVDGRYHTRNGDSHLGGHDLMGAILRIADVAPPADAAAFKSFLKAAMVSDTSLDFVSNHAPPYSIWANAILNDPGVTPLAGMNRHRQFPSMDRVVHHTTNWTFGLSMASSRVANYESTRGENLKGWFTGEGVTYLYNDDLTHYSDNYWSTIDPYRLPGTTVDTIARTNGSGQSYRSPNNQVGGASILGLYGVAAMNLNAYGVGTMSARNSWFMFDNEIVCAGNSVSSSNGRETILENRRLGVYGNNPFTVNGVPQPTGPGWSQTMGATTWAHLAGTTPGADIGYFFPSPTTVKGLRENRTGRFYDINTTYGSKTSSTRSYLTLYIDHGTSTNATNYSYVLLPGYSAAQMAAYAANPEVLVLQNNSTATAVTKPRLGITAVNFWKDTSNQVAGISSDHKAAVILRNDGSVLDLGASDPTQTNKAGLRIEVNVPGISVLALDPGVTVLRLAPTLKLLLNTSNKLGGTLRAKILVNASGQGPSVTLGASCDANVDAPATVALIADARDADGTVARLDFYSSTTRIAQVFGPISGITNVVVPNLAAGNYEFQAVAVDNAGLTATSAVVNIAVAAPRGPGRGTGLVGEYYKDLGEFKVLTLIRTDTNINFSWPNGASHPIAQSDHFSVRWTGKLQAQHSGWHQFFTQTDDGVRLWIDGRLLIDDWGRHPRALVEDVAGMSLVAGRYYDIRMEYFENTEPAVARLLWIQPGGVKELIPPSQLYPASQGLLATYYSGISLVSSAAQRVRTDNTIQFVWGTNSPDPSILSAPFAARWSGKVRADVAGTHAFFTLSSDAVRLFVNGQLIVNNWTAHALTENSNTLVLPVAGQYYDVVMEYFNQSGAGTAVLSWQPPGGVKQVIPAANLTPFQNNNPPVLGAIDDRLVERDNPVTFPAGATDPDGGQSLTYSLDAGAPEGATINSTNGIFNWTPSSPLPGGSYSVTVRVTDNGSPLMSDSKPLRITVKVVNNPPSIGAISDQLADPGRLMSVLIPVADSDVPAQTLSRSLLTGPPEASLSASGVFSWTPSLAHASTTNLVMVKVTDDGIPPLSATQAFTIVVSANLPCVGYKGDVAPRLGGNGSVTIADWVQLGRFAAGTAGFSNACERAAADCAPKPCGDGSITIADWVQTGRYAAGLDSLVQMGNCPPSNGFVPAGLRLLNAPVAESVLRRLSVSDLPIEQGRTNVVPIVLETEGGENALGFSLRFNTNLLSFVSARPGAAASGAALHVNASVAGGLGFALALSPGQTFSPGRVVVAEILMRAAGRTHPVSTTVVLVDQPIAREIDDAEAMVLPSHYDDGVITITSGSALLFETVKMDPAGHLGVTAIGQEGVVWTLQSSSDLKQWQSIGTLTNVTGRVNYLDSTTGISGHRFYRAIRAE